MSVILKPGTSDPPRRIYAHDINRSGQIAAFRSYWEQLRGADGTVMRAHIKPEHIVRILPHIVIYEPAATLAGQTDYRFRLVGTWCVGIGGIDATGRTIRDYFCGPHLQALLAEFDDAMRTAAPVYSVGKVPLQGFSSLPLERGLFPVIDGTRQQFFCVMDKALTAALHADIEPAVTDASPACI